MHILINITLPRVILESDDFKSLSDNQQSELLARIRFYSKLADSFHNAHSLTIDELLNDLDEAELDGLSYMSINNADDRSISWYRIHSSWFAFASTKFNINIVDETVRELLSLNDFKYSLEVESIREWLSTWSISMNKTIYLLLNADLISSAFAHMVICNVLMARLISMIGLTRVTQS